MNLTIGMSAYDDFDGVYFTVQSLRLYHDLKDTEILVVDNNPSSNHGKATKHFLDSIGCKYISYENKTGTSVRNEIFRNAQGKYTLCVDCHVLLKVGFLDSLLNYYKEHEDCKDILSGPLCDDNFNVVSTQFDPVWRCHMYGTWGFDKEKYESGNPFEIPMMGLGVFSCETKNWLWFNEDFHGFGAEEGYIHEKFRQAGGKAICIPKLHWMHRFGRPGGTKYPNKMEDRIWNYFIGWLELTKDPDHQIIKDIKEHFKECQKVDEVFAQAKEHYGL